MRWRSELHLLLTSGLVLAGSMACGEDYPRGELMVVVTTDMAVPHDIDTLGWTVTLPGQSRPFRTGSVSLTAVGLPATLAVASGRRTTDPVVIEVEGLVGGADGRSRIRRSAEVRVPTDGVKSLPMPLNWLCSEANLRTPCDSDETCQAGQCRDRSVDESSLRDYEEEAAPACFDVADCFGSPLTQVRQPDREGVVAPGRCALRGGVEADAAPDANVALVVNNEAVGNYGVCGADNCRVPLPRDSEEGWQALIEDGQTLAIIFPDRVCELRNTVNEIAIAPLARNVGCSVKSLQEPLCVAEQRCLAAGADAGICPSGWPAEWTGYTCSASQSPQIPDTRTYCGQLGTEDPNDTPPGMWCCTSGQDPPTAWDGLIDDMSLGSQIQIPPPDGFDVGFWRTSTDDTSAPIFPRPNELFTYRAIDPPVTPEGGPEISQAACLRSDGFSGSYAQMGFNFIGHIGTDDVRRFDVGLFDVSEYTGISFWKYTPLDVPQTVSVLITDRNTDAYYAQSTCNQPDTEGQCGAAFGKHGVILRHEWQQELVRWDELEQNLDEHPGAEFEQFDQGNAIALLFQVDGNGADGMSVPFDFCVADIRFTTD